jgi:dCTP deaminase
MMLSDRDLKEYLAAGRIRIDPAVQDEDIRPNGIRVHLGDTILVPRARQDPIELDMSNGPEFDEVTIGKEGRQLLPGELVLGATREIIAADADLICQIDGRSTLARLGLMVHLGSTTFDHIQANGRAVTLELLNVGPFIINLRAGHPIALVPRHSDYDSLDVTG